MPVWTSRLDVLYMTVLWYPAAASAPVEASCRPSAHNCCVMSMPGLYVHLLDQLELS
jgi:hypothetical protein